jgi:hypothetical protein
MLLVDGGLVDGWCFEVADGLKVVGKEVVVGAATELVVHDDGRKQSEAQIRADY